MKTFLSVILVIALLGIALPGLCQSAPVIGKVVIPANAQVVLVTLDTGQIFGGISFEEQTFYITETAIDDDGTTVLGYVTAPESFKHNCRTHGLEVIDNSIIMIPTKLIVDGIVKLELFNQ
jgi:hypothetical protein